MFPITWIRITGEVPRTATQPPAFGGWTLEADFCSGSVGLMYLCTPTPSLCTTPEKGIDPGLSICLTAQGMATKRCYIDDTLTCSCRVIDGG